MKVANILTKRYFESTFPFVISMDSAVHNNENSSVGKIALGLLAGILLIGFGYFQNDAILLSIGLAITIAGVMLGILRLVVFPPPRKTR